MCSCKTPLPIEQNIALKISNSFYMARMIAQTFYDWLAKVQFSIQYVHEKKLFWRFWINYSLNLCTGELGDRVRLHLTISA